MSFVRHIACPECGSSDARAVYDDASEYCFSCRAKSGGTALSRHRAVAKVHKLFDYQDSHILPPAALAWLGKYDLSPQEIYLYTYDYQTQHLIFRDLGFTNARNFDFQNDKKYISYGMKPYSVRGVGRWLVCVEDAVSMIKVSRHTPAMALYGSEIPVVPVLNAMKEYYKGLLIWLDPDKIISAVKFSQKFQELGIRCKVISSDQDPKDYTDREIRTFLRKATQ